MTYFRLLDAKTRCVGFKPIGTPLEGRLEERMHMGRGGRVYGFRVAVKILGFYYSLNYRKM